MTGATGLTIETFRKLLLVEKRKDKLIAELHTYVQRIPADEMLEYIAITTEMASETPRVRP